MEGCSRSRWSSDDIQGSCDHHDHSYLVMSTLPAPSSPLPFTQEPTSRSLLDSPSSSTHTDSIYDFMQTNGQLRQRPLERQLPPSSTLATLASGETHNATAVDRGRHLWAPPPTARAPPETRLCAVRRLTMGRSPAASWRLEFPGSGCWRRKRKRSLRASREVEMEATA